MRVAKFLPIWNALAPLVLASGLLMSCAGRPGAGRVESEPDPPLLTIGERSDFFQTGTLAQTTAQLEAVAERSDRMTLTALGRSVEGRPIPMAVIADPPVGSVEDVGDRAVVLLFGSIHAGEICGKEALGMIARDLALADDPDVLDDLVVVIVPILNVDGNERMAPDNRPGQNGPERMGIRRNAQGLDLNRDWTKLDAPETRAVVAFLNQWDPLVVVDTHTTNGSLHRYTLTYQGPKHPAGDEEILRTVRDELLPTVARRVARRTGYQTFFYGNFADDHTKWVTYPAEPRYGVAYRGLRSVHSVLAEAYAYATFRDRVLATRAFCDEILRYTSRHRGKMESQRRSARGEAIGWGERPESAPPLPVRIEVRPFPQRVEILGYEEQVGPEGRVAPVRPRSYECEFWNDFVGTEFVRTPWAYVVPAECVEALELLRAHGIEMREIDRSMGHAGVRYRIDAMERSDRVYEGHRRVDLSVSIEPATISLRPGDFMIPMAQAKGRLAAYLLEPRATDGLAAWNVFDQWLEPGKAYPVVRIQTSIDPSRP